MTLTVDHIKTIVVAIDAGWSPAELVDDMISGINHFGLASINAPALVDQSIDRLPTFAEVEVEIEPVLSSGFYNQYGSFEPDYDDEISVAVTL